MGLDMYLTAEHYIGAEFSHRGVEGTVDIMKKKTYDEGSSRIPVKIQFDRISTITERIGYWRKANAIHSWFVDNVQGGVDECQSAYVERSQLEELLKACKQELVSHDALNPKEGFFFGSAEKGEWFEEYIRETIEILEGALAMDASRGDLSFYYRASW